MCLLARFTACGFVCVLVTAVAPAAAVELLDEDKPPAAAIVRRAPAPTRTLGLPLRVGAFAGWHAAAGDLDVLGERVVGNSPDPGPAFGLRLGWRVAERWGIELLAGASSAGAQWLVPVVGELRWRPLEGRAITPTVGIGAGMYAGFGAGADVDLLVAAAVGAEVALGRTMVLRIELGLWGSDAVEGAIALNPVVTVGVDLLAWRDVGDDHVVEPEPGSAPVPVPKGCPPGVAGERCVDTDGDGIIDAYDRCPVDAGGIDGCADADGDQVPGPRDACPARSGRLVDWGCPR